MHMRALVSTLLVLTAGISPGCLALGMDGLDDARGARALLSPETWARIVKIDNSHPKGAWRSNVYPKTVYALVFELSGALWLYTDAEGTQSLSRTLGTLARDEADPGPLLRAIEPGIGTWEWVDEPSGPPAKQSANPPKACVEESLQALSRRIAQGGETISPRLLFYYVDTPVGRLGHTVLVFRTAKGLSAIDPQVSARAVIVPSDLGTDLRSIAEYLRGAPVASAKAFPITPSRRDVPGSWVALPSHGSPTG